MNRLSITPLFICMLGVFYTGSLSAACNTHDNATMQLYFSAPAGLIVNSGNEDEKHVSVSVIGSNNKDWYYYPAGTTTENGYLLGGSSTCPGINGYYRLDITAKSNHKTIHTHIEINETAQPCVMTVDNKFYHAEQSHIYKVNFENHKDGESGQRNLIRGVDVCGSKDHKLSIKLGSVVNSFLLPMDITGFNDADKTGDPDKVYLPITA